MAGVRRWTEEEDQAIRAAADRNREADSGFGGQGQHGRLRAVAVAFGLRAELRRGAQPRDPDRCALPANRGSVNTRRPVSRVMRDGDGDFRHFRAHRWR